MGDPIGEIEHLRICRCHGPRVSHIPQSCDRGYIRIEIDLTALIHMAFDRLPSDLNDDIYDPSYTDMLRVAFTSEFGRGKLHRR